MNAIILTAGLLNASDAKTAHGLIRESKRFKIVGIIDEVQAGRDAGEVLDGKNRNIPVYKTISESLQAQPQYCIIGVATPGGVFPEAMVQDVKTTIRNGLSVVNGLHDLLSERKEIAELAEEHKVQIIDIRKPKPRRELHFWTGEILRLHTPVVAILGTDCSMGKRTTQRLLMSDCKAAGINAQLIYTGQTGWLQGGEYGFIFDSTLNDFVPGELEHQVLSCAKETAAEIILIEGQSALRNPTGPCGSELIISGNAKHVVLVHAPKRKYFHNNIPWGEIPSLESEIELIKLFGAEVIAIALNTADCSHEEAMAFQNEYQQKLGIPVVLPLQEGCARVIPLLKNIISRKVKFPEINVSR
jgi:uncharacterized NAD-dependent epimerase/dehydratase family protein